MHDTLVADYDALGAAGGGTLLLRPGVFYVNETLDFQKYSNVSIQGSGPKKTTLSLPLDPVQNFRNDNGTLVGLFNESLDGPVNGPYVNFVQVLGPSLNNFEMCDLSVNARANSSNEDWAGSLIMDAGGGHHHVYSDIDEVGLYGPSGTPNGLHIDGYNHPALGYEIDKFNATKVSWPTGNHSFYSGGPNFLNVGDVTNCTLENISGTGNLEFEVAPSVGCTVENLYVQGHMLIDPLYETTNTGGNPLPLGSWGGTLFQNVTIDVEGTNGPNSLDISDTNGTIGTSDFNHLRWNRDDFLGGVFAAQNMVDVTNSTFEGGIDALPALFAGNSVVWAPSLLGRDSMMLPIMIDGLPSATASGGNSSFLSGNSFDFPNGTGIRDPLRLKVSDNTWENITVKIGGTTRGFVVSAPNVTVSQNSTFSGISYDSLGNGSPSKLLLFDFAGSSDFQDLGAAVGQLSHVTNNIPLYIPSAPTGLKGTSLSPTKVNLSWDAATGPVTNYTILSGPDAAYLTPLDSVGLHTSYEVRGLPPGGAVYFAVEAWNNSFRSGIDGTVEVITPDYTPSVPLELEVTNSTAAEVGLQWDPSLGHVTNYTVYAGTSGVSLTPRYSAGTVTAYSATNLDPDTTYYFAVQAWNDSWDSNLSSVVAGTTLPGTGPGEPNPPQPPTGLAIVGDTVSEVALQWVPPAGTVTNYTVLAGPDASDLVPTFSVGVATSYTVAGLTPNTTYYFAIQSWNGSLASEPSGVVNATTLHLSTPATTHPATIPGWGIEILALVGTPCAIVLPLALVGRHRARTRSGTTRAPGQNPGPKGRRSS